jgi:hypothetical protein
MNRLPSRKNCLNASSGCATAATAVRVRRAHLARVLRELQRGIGRAGDVRVQGPDHVEHRAVHHRPRRGIGRIEAFEPVLVAEVLHDRAALPQRSLRQSLLLEQRCQVSWILRKWRGPSTSRPLARTRARAHEVAGASGDGQQQFRVVSEYPRCAALLHGGKRCRSAAQNGSEFCPHHSGLVAEHGAETLKRGEHLPAAGCASCRSR